MSSQGDIIKEFQQKKLRLAVLEVLRLRKYNRASKTHAEGTPESMMDECVTPHAVIATASRVRVFVPVPLEQFVSPARWE